TITHNKSFSIMYRMVEVVTAALKDQLVDPLSFTLTKTVSYITNRRSCTYHPQWGNYYSVINGTKLVKMIISSTDWLDPSTFRIMFDLKMMQQQRILVTTYTP
ncbi:MAG: hypothetical protein ACKPKO_46180, partial [Candidatus Fonsibacter sp.]